MSIRTNSALNGNSRFNATLCGVGNQPSADARGRDLLARVTNPLVIIDRERQETRRATKQLTALPHRRLSPVNSFRPQCGSNIRHDAAKKLER